MFSAFKTIQIFVDLKQITLKIVSIEKSYVKNTVHFTTDLPYKMCFLKILISFVQVSLYRYFKIVARYEVTTCEKQWN